MSGVTESVRGGRGWGDKDRELMHSVWGLKEDL